MSSDVKIENLMLCKKEEFYSITTVNRVSPMFFVFAVEFVRLEARVERVFAKNEFFFFRKITDSFFEFPIIFLETRRYS